MSRPKTRAKRANKTCPHKTPGCDFSEWDHHVMEMQHQTCADWILARKRGREFCTRLAANARARQEGRPAPYPRLLDRFKGQPDREATEPEKRQEDPVEAFWGA